MDALAAREFNVPGDNVVIGIVADTHIPDRVIELHPQILPLLREAGVSHILHAGDIAVRRVLTELAQVAPVTAVRGNRDLLLNDLPLVVQLEFNGVKIALMHGHGGWRRYLLDKISYIRHGYRLHRYLAWMPNAAGDAKIIVFGHTHYSEQLWRGGRLYLNPGSASFGTRGKRPPSIGLLYIRPNGKIKTRILPMPGYMVKNRHWIEEPLRRG
jgi:putative phosphoesterase